MRACEDLGWGGSARQNEQQMPRSDMAQAWLAEHWGGLCGRSGRAGGSWARRQSRRVPPGLRGRGESLELILPAMEATGGL